MINRCKVINHLIPTIIPVVVPPIYIPVIPPVDPVIPTIIPVIPPTTTYVLADFGENALNNHSSNDVGHSETVQKIFNYITKDFRGRCTSIQTYNTLVLGDGMIDSSRVLDDCKLEKADIVFTPYVDAASWMNHEYYDFVLPVSSHYDNDYQMGETPIGENRHDITANASIFLPYSVAVSARRDTPELFKLSTSCGFGMEFFEDCSPEALDIDYPTKDVPSCFAEVRTSSDGYTMYGNRTMDMYINSRLSIGDSITLINGSLSETRIINSILPNGTYTVTEPFTPYVVIDFITLKTMIDGVLTKIGEIGTEDNGLQLRAHNIKTTDFTTLSIGQEVTLTYPDSHTETKIVSKINRYDFITLTTSATNYQIPGIYVWYNDTIGRFVGGQAESWATPLIAGKLKAIKMTTNADWPTVRNAARLTAKRNPTGISEIDNVNWDMYRGFGSIRVNDAIQYINNSKTIGSI